MRKRTIHRRMRLSTLPKSLKDDLFKKMRGISDKATLQDEGQQKWIAAVKEVFERKTLNDKERSD